MNAAAIGSKPSLDEIFGALPPLGSGDYLRHLRQAATEDLPPEVLVRAYRELAASGDDDGSRATLARLLGERGGRPEYLQSLLYLAAKSVPPHQHWQEAGDLYQDAVALILEALPTEQGRFAERAWTTFCYQRLRDAWRRRQGRRGERTEPRRVELAADGDGSRDALDPPAASPPPWHAAVGPDKLAWLEGFVRRTLERIPDPFIRGVAEDQWLSGDPSPISATRRRGVRPPLTERFGKSRYQIHRALNGARARLLAALETQNEMEIDLARFRHET